VAVRIVVTLPPLTRNASLDPGGDKSALGADVIA
jgi:hypothetical protein